ncbi:hypothetical protein GCM10009098_15140 [Rheinheimera aquimaris]|uniref:Tetratricopeptide repeat protein n=2 Tax=Rheinheimera aquimaris TaxID=412437 RepID=A0ABN1DP02_9GAMM
MHAHNMPVIILILLLCGFTAQAEPLSSRMVEASDSAEQISNQLLSRPADSLTAEDWLVLTEAQLRLRNKDAAMDAVSHVLDVSHKPYLQAYAYLLKAQIYGILYRDTVIAITQLERAEHLLQHAEDAASLALYSDVLQNFAQAYNQLGNIPQALPYAERSLALAVRQQQPEAELKARITLGRLMLQNNAYSQAYQQLNSALVLATQLQDDDALASIHLRLGMAYRKIEYHSQALQHLLEAKQRYQHLQRQSSYTYTLIYIAETYLEDNQTAAEAAAYLDEALKLAHEQNDLLRVGIVTLGLGRLAVVQQHEELALQYFNDALQLFRQQQVQTYLQETSLALADLLLQRQQHAQSGQLLQEIAPQMPQAAAYLRYRFHDLSARLFAGQGDWVQAYQNSQQANTLRFEQLAEQSKLQLDLINQGLQQAKTEPVADIAVNTVTDQNKRQLLYIYILAALCMLLAAALLVAAAILRRNSKARSEPQQQSHWNSFCLRLQQHSAKTNISILAYGLDNSLQLKMQHGEQQLQAVLQQFQQQLSTTVFASCLYDDVLWLAVQSEAEDNTKQQTLAGQLQQLLPETLATAQLISLQLPVSDLLESPWLTKEINALREALWLSLALCGGPSTDRRQPRLMALHSRQHRACEWRSNMVRQDLLNAIRLGGIELTCNNTVLPATVADQLA